MRDRAFVVSAIQSITRPTTFLSFKLHTLLQLEPRLSQDRKATNIVRMSGTDVLRPIHSSNKSHRTTIQPDITDFASHYDLLNYMTWLLTVT